MSSSKRKNKESRDSYKEEEDESSLVKRPQVRRHIVLDDESNVPQNQPSDFVSFHLVDEPQNFPLDISKDENASPALNSPSTPIEMLFAQGFEGEEESLTLFLKSLLLQPFL